MRAFAPHQRASAPTPLKRSARSPSACVARAPRSPSAPSVGSPSTGVRRVTIPAGADAMSDLSSMSSAPSETSRSASSSPEGSSIRRALHHPPDELPQPAPAVGDHAAQTNGSVFTLKTTRQFSSRVVLPRWDRCEAARRRSSGLGHRRLPERAGEVLDVGNAALLRHVAATAAAAKIPLSVLNAGISGIRATPLGAARRIRRRRPLPRRSRSGRSRGRLTDMIGRRDQRDRATPRLHREPAHQARQRLIAQAHRGGEWRSARRARGDFICATPTGGAPTAAYADAAGDLLVRRAE